MNEEWKDILGFEGRYRVNREGVVINKSGKEVKQEVSQRGYLRVRLCKDKKTFNIKVHRIVAESYIENPYNLPQVDHINGNKHDNRVGNLRWVDNITNNNAFRSEHNHKQPVGIVDCNGNLLYSFGSLREAESKIGVSRFGITAACNGIQQSAGGYKWRFLRHGEHYQLTMF